MKIKKLHIQNYKSLVNLEIIEPNPFTVFAGSNGAGKSNIFEALEFFQFNANNDPYTSHKAFGGIEDILSKNPRHSFEKYAYGKEDRKEDFERIGFSIEYLEFNSELNIVVDTRNNLIDFVTTGLLNSKLNLRQIEEKLRANQFINPYAEVMQKALDAGNSEIYKMFFFNSSRLFVNNLSYHQRDSNSSDTNLSTSAVNLEKVLGRLLRESNKKEEILNWLDLLIPGFSNIEVIKEPINGKEVLAFYEKGTKNPFPRNLLSDGTKNILALLTAVYQCDEKIPQFLCIEEPENGLNPKVQKELVNLFRQKCEDEGHYIWLNTHSQTIVNQLTPKELILVDKVDGETKIKQLTDFDLHGLTMDEAWLTNSFGGGIPW
jgi:predicted ATPase